MKTWKSMDCEKPDYMRLNERESKQSKVRRELDRKNKSIKGQIARKLQALFQLRAFFALLQLLLGLRAPRFFITEESSFLLLGFYESILEGDGGREERGSPTTSKTTRQGPFSKLSHFQ